MDIFDVITADHEKVKKILEQMQHTTSKAGKRREQLLQSLTENLQPHMYAEEQYFYQVLLDETDEKEVAFEALNFSAQQPDALFHVHFEQSVHLFRLKHAVIRTDLFREQKYVLELVLHDAGSKTVHENPAAEGHQFLAFHIDSQFFRDLPGAGNRRFLSCGIMSSHAYIKPVGCYFLGHRTLLEQGIGPALPLVNDEAMEGAMPGARFVRIIPRYDFAGFFARAIQHVKELHRVLLWLPDNPRHYR